MPHLHVRLRQVDIKAEHFERQVQRVEQERDEWTRKHEVCATTIKPQYRLADCVFHAQEMETKHSKAKADLDELVANMEGL
jgi:tropomyosin